MLEDLVVVAQRRHSHPLVRDDEEDEEEPDLPVQTKTIRNPSRAIKEPPASAEPQPCSPPPGKMEETEIEMQVRITPGCVNVTPKAGL